MQNIGVEYQINRLQATGSYECDGPSMTYTKGAFVWSGHPVEFVFRLANAPVGLGDRAVKTVLEEPLRGRTVADLEARNLDLANVALTPR